MSASLLYMHIVTKHNVILIFHLVDEYTNIFGIVQFFGFVFALFAGFIMEIKPKNTSNPYFGPMLCFIITNVICVLLGSLVLVPVLEVQVNQ